VEHHISYILVVLVLIWPLGAVEDVPLDDPAKLFLESPTGSTTLEEWYCGIGWANALLDEMRMEEWLSELCMKEWLSKILMGKRPLRMRVVVALGTVGRRV